MAAAAVVVALWGYGWRGLVLAISVIVFWLLLQFSRSLRVLRQAAQSPVGQVDNAVTFQARLHAGARLPEVVGLTRSLGRKASDDPEVFVWRDGGGDEVALTFVNGRCAHWQLRRADAADSSAPDR